MNTLLKSTLTLAGALLLGTASAQEFPVQWKSGFNFSPDKLRSYNFDGSLILGANNGNITMLDGNTGKTLWEYNFKEKFGRKSFDRMRWNDSGAIELITNDTKKEKGSTILLDEKTGAVLSVLPAPQSRPKIEAVTFKSKFRTANTVSLNDKDLKITLDYKKSLFNGASGNKKRDITLTCTKISTGGQQWSTPFQAKYVTTMTTSDDIIWCDVSGDKVFVVSEGIAVFDLGTGKYLWGAEFNNSDVSIGLKATQKLGISAMPVIDGSYIYIPDLDNSKSIKKYELATGKVIWQTPKISADILPLMLNANGVLLAQCGGRINVQTYIPGTNGVATYKNEYKFEGDFGIKAFDAQSGKLLWDTEKMKSQLGDKFSDRITDIQLYSGNLYVCSDRNYFILNPKSGEVISKVSLEEIGKAVDLVLDEKSSTAYAFGDKGIASFSLKDNTKHYAMKLDGYFGSFTKGKNFFVWLDEDKEKFIGFDLAAGRIKGKYKTKSNPDYLLTEDGEYLVEFDSNKVKRLKIN